MTFAVNIAQGGSNNTTFRNRIINGAMVIDQRNNGASATFANTGGYSVDRWRISNAVSTVTAQQSTVAPAGFTNSLLVTVTSADSNPPSTSTSHAIQYYIEGLNVADFAWGTANAQPITLSFWVRSSLTGTYGIQIGNAAPATRAYVAQYTINSANTFEYKTITIPGDTTGTWATNTSIGVAVIFDLGSGSSFQTASANTWVATDSRRISGNALFASTASATFYITGVQLEEGTAASPFEFRQYGTELALCQRYLPAFNADSSGGFQCFGSSQQGSGTTRIWTSFKYPVSTRVPATGVTISSASDFLGGGQNTNFTCSSVSFLNSSITDGFIFFDGSGGTVQQAVRLLSNNTANAKIYFTGCEL